MKLSAVLVITVALAAVSLTSGKKRTCKGNGRTVVSFSRRKDVTRMPCKYHAVRQTCGNYRLTVTPGNIYVKPSYRLNILWLGVHEVGSGQSWQGRISSKLAVKYIYGWKNESFVKKDGELDTKDVLVFGKNRKRVWAEAKNGDFKVTFTPWDPAKRKFRESSWELKCSTNSVEGYPDQICGGDKKDMKNRTAALGFEDRIHVIYYDVFTHTGITHTNPKCENATQVMTNDCTLEQRKEAILKCSQILHKNKYTKCVTKYTCDLMDVFLDCLRWVCSDYKDKDSCERLAKAIDLCREFKEGDLTKEVVKSGCYKGYHFVN